MTASFVDKNTRCVRIYRPTTDLKCTHLSIIATERMWLCTIPFKRCFFVLISY